MTKAAGPWYRFTGFRHLRTRLAVLYGLLFAASLLVVAGSAEVMILRHAAEAARDELSASGSVFERIWTFRRDALTNSAEVLARDFGFRSAVMSGDAPTIDSAVETLRARAKVDNAFVIDQAGQVIGSGANDLRPVVAKLPFTLPDNARSAVVTAPSGVYRVVLSPIMAPTEIGWVVFAIRLDDDEMRALQRLSAVPLHAAIVRRTAKGWSIAAGTAPVDNAALTRFLSGPHDGIATLGSFGGEALALAHPLAGDGNQARAILLLSYPLATALAPYRLLQLGLISAGLLGLLLVVWGSRRLANAIARPVAALDAAAKALEEGTRTEVAIQGKDELARLAESFNTMSAGIVERENRITHLAFHDGLTALPNRVLFREQLEATIGRAAKRGGQVSVLCLDLDGFKGVNDTLGHQAGDALLRQVAERLRHVCRETDLIARLGGDEFAIIQIDAASPADGSLLAEKVLNILAQPFVLGENEANISASIGLAVAPQDGRVADELLRKADGALYRAKHNGRSAYSYFTRALDIETQNRHRDIGALRDAVRDQAFFLVYQPKIASSSGQAIVGMEALLRCSHPQLAQRPIREVIRLAAECGQIHQLSEWVIAHACKQARFWFDQGHASFTTCVNLCARELACPSTLDTVDRTLETTGLRAGDLNVELTEQALFESKSVGTKVLRGLSERGVTIALDDFGTGYSSLSYLTNLPVNLIKLDVSLTRSLPHDEQARKVVHAVIDLAHALELEVVAEGMEQKEQLLAMRQMQCDALQGYYISRPLVAALMTRWMKERRPWLG